MTEGISERSVLVDGLRINWGGDHGRIGALLAQLPAPFRVVDNGPGGVFEIFSDAAAGRLAEPYPDLDDHQAVRARISRITARGVQRSGSDWEWLNDVLARGDRADQGVVVRHLAGTPYLREDAFQALMAGWQPIYSAAPKDVLISGLLQTLRERGDERYREVMPAAAKRTRWTFYAGVSHELDRVGTTADLPLLYQLAGRPGHYEHTAGDGTALRAWLRLRAQAEGRTRVEVVEEALDDPHFDAAARKELRRQVERERSV